MSEEYLNSKRIRALIFDLDGTLLDSFSVHYEAYKNMFEHLGVAFDESTFFQSYSPNWYLTYEVMGLPERAWKEADDYWVNEAKKHDPPLLPEALETLSTLKKRFVLGLVTSGSKNRVMADLKRTELNTFFEIIITGDDVFNPKPHPEGLEMALNTLQIKPDEAVYIGDALADFQMAKAAGVSFLGVISRFNSLNREDTRYSVHTLPDIAALFEE